MGLKDFIKDNYFRINKTRKHKEYSEDFYKRFLGPCPELTDSLKRLKNHEYIDHKFGFTLPNLLEAVVITTAAVTKTPLLAYFGITFGELVRVGTHLNHILFKRQDERKRIRIRENHNNLEKVIEYYHKYDHLTDQRKEY